MNQKGSFSGTIAEKRARRSKIVEEIESANEEIQGFNQQIALIQERLKGLNQENMKAKMEINVLLEMNGEDPEEDVVPPVREARGMKDVLPDQGSKE